MRKEVEHYQGKKIDIVIISKLFAISIARDFRVEGIVPYSDVDTIEELCEICECNIDDFHVILGADWYLTYIDRQDSLEIMEWVSLANPKDKMRQTLEMMRYLIKVLLLSKDRKITAIMHHSTSYNFYQLLIKNGYVKELYNNPGMDNSLPEDLRLEVDKSIEENVNIRGYLNNSERDTDLDEYFYHDISFKITDKFLSRYNKPTK